jgi:predicted esterase
MLSQSASSSWSLRMRSRRSIVLFRRLRTKTWPPLRKIQFALLTSGSVWNNGTRRSFLPPTHVSDQVATGFTLPELFRRRWEEFHMACVRTPKGDRPPKGWPVLLFLHGAGDYGGAHAVHAESAAEHGFFAIAPSGPFSTRRAGRAWPAHGFAVTDQYLQEILARWEEREQMDRTRVFLCGFSQGATHAIGLLLSRPEEYRGALALSPGEGPAIPTTLKSACRPRPLYVIYGRKEFRVFRKKAQRCAALWQRAKWPCLLETHPGSHHFPGDWDSRFPRLVGWLESASHEAEKLWRFS